MTTTPNEPVVDPEVGPLGDPEPTADPGTGPDPDTEPEGETDPTTDGI